MDPAELYVNTAADSVGPEDYRDVYLLVERIEIGAEMLDITRPTSAYESADLSGGYLLKLEAWGIGRSSHS